MKYIKQNSGTIITVFSIMALFIFLGIRTSPVTTILDDQVTQEENSNTDSVFEGEITNTKVSPSIIEGIGAYDRSCTPVQGGLTQCDGGISTEEYGVLNFNYIHDMHTEPCIVPGEIFTVEILDQEGKATVTRTSASLH